MKYRRWLSFHRYLGLAFAAHWLLLAVTGMLLVFHRDIEFAMLSSGTVPDTTDLDVAAYEIKGQRPGCDLQRISTLAGGETLLRVLADCGNDGPRSLIYDAGIRKVVGDSAPSGSIRRDGFFQFIYRLHQTLLLDGTGKTLVAISGLFMCLSVFIGFRLIWPQRKRLKALVAPRISGNARQRAILRHRAIGIIAGPFLILTALTGAGMNWTPALDGMMQHIGLATAKPVLAEVTETAAPLIGPQRALEIAEARYPRASFTSVTMPGIDNRYYVVRVRQPGEAHAIFGLTSVTINATDGRIAAAHDPFVAPAGNVVLEWLFALHNGEILGVTGRLFILALGGGLLTLGVLGVLAWNRSWSPRQAGNRSRANYRSSLASSEPEKPNADRRTCLKG